MVNNLNTDRFFAASNEIAFRVVGNNVEALVRLSEDDEPKIFYTIETMSDSDAETVIVALQTVHSLGHTEGITAFMEMMRQSLPKDDDGQFRI